LRSGSIRCCLWTTASMPCSPPTRTWPALRCTAVCSHGISRPPDVERDKPSRKKFKADPIGYVHINIAEVRTEEGKLYLFVAVHRLSNVAFAQLHDSATVKTAAAFLQALIEAAPFKLRTVLTDNGVQFCDRPSRRSGPTAG
jgi:integrase-like protein